MRGDSKVESNDSPETGGGGRGETSDIPGLPSGGQQNKVGHLAGCRFPYLVLTEYK